MLRCDSTTLRAMQGVEKVEVDFTNFHLGAACSDHDDGYNGEDNV